jgi:hypothetical protein
MTIAKRIEKIEALIKAAPGAVLLREPPVDALEAEFYDHAQEVADALLQEAVVIVRRNGSDRLRRPGVIYVDDDFNGLLAVLAHTPADDGKSKDRLSQILSEAQGSALPVVRGVRNGTL